VTSLTHDEIRELLGAYALDAVDPDEAIAVEDHLRDCPRCRAEVAEHRETAAFLAHAGADAPPDVWDRIADTIDVPAPVVPLAPRLGGATRARPRGWPAAIGLVGAAAAVVIAVLVVQVREQDRRIDRMETASDVFTAALNERGARVVHLDAGSTEVPVVLTSNGMAYLQAASLPELANGRTYQLWGASDDELVSVAVLGRDPGVVSFEAAGYSALAITEEDAPGVVKTNNDPIASGALT